MAHEKYVIIGDYMDKHERWYLDSPQNPFPEKDHEPEYWWTSTVSQMADWAWDTVRANKAEPHPNDGEQLKVWANKKLGKYLKQGGANIRVGKATSFVVNKHWHDRIMERFAPEYNKTFWVMTLDEATRIAEER